MKISPDIRLCRTGRKITVSVGVTLYRRAPLCRTEIRKGITMSLGTVR